MGKGKDAPGEPPAGRQRELSSAARRHLRFGWWSLLVFLALGLGLEALHGFKVGWYLDLAHQTRRLMWTLAHAHGTLLALINIAYGATLVALGAPGPAAGFGSRWLLASSVLLPAGFFFGGLVTYGGDPSPGIALAALGGLTLLAAILAIARSIDAVPGAANTRSPKAK